MEETDQKLHTFINVQVRGSSQRCFGVGWLDSGKWGVREKMKTLHVIAEHEHFPKSAPLLVNPLPMDGLSNHIYNILLKHN